jgi:hypothetical protein
MGQNKAVYGGYLTESTGQDILTALGGAGLSSDQLILHDHAAAAVNTTYTAVGGALAADVIKLDIFDSSGEPLILGVDPAGGTAFVDEYFIAPGGNGFVELGIASGSTLGIKRQAVTGGADTSAGFLLITLLG